MAIKTKIVSNEQLFEKLESLEKLLSTQEVPMKAEEAAKFLSLNISTVRSYASKGILPAYKVEGNTYFLKSELINRIKPNPLMEA